MHMKRRSRGQQASLFFLALAGMINKLEQTCLRAYLPVGVQLCDCIFLPTLPTWRAYLATCLPGYLPAYLPVDVQLCDCIPLRSRLDK